MIKKIFHTIKPFQVIAGILVIVLIIIAYRLVWEAESTLDTSSWSQDFTMIMPLLWWEIDFRTTGLLIASLFIWLLDGFNPCAMWVLIYLITLVANMQDKKKMWFIVWTFLFASGLLYFMIVSLWLNGWELLKLFGMASWILYAVWGFALFTGILAIKDFIEKWGNITCEVWDAESKKKTASRIKDIVNSPITLATIFATILLALGINSIEFVCSAGLPAIYTQILSVADVSSVVKYLNIGLYTLAFMADDLLIFTLALMAVNSNIMMKYSGLSKLVGGIIMIAIGIILLFYPELLI